MCALVLLISRCFWQRATFVIFWSASGRTLVKFTVIQAVLCRALNKVPAHLVVHCTTQLTKAACLKNIQLSVDKAAVW